MEKKVKIGIAGGAGYTGLELMKILNRHRYADIMMVSSRTYKGLKVKEAFPLFSCSKIGDLVFTEGIYGKILNEVDVLFLCLPPLKSMEYLKENISNINCLVVDLGSDFRLKSPEDFKIWYGTEHILKNLLGDFVYGLSEINRRKIKNCRFIANPGCYPTSVLLGLAPLLKNKNIEIKNLIIDSKSGVTGAGRKIKPEYIFCNVNENFSAYSTIMHRHIGEMEQEIEQISRKKIKVCFTPYLLPLDRGIFTTIYCELDLNFSSKLKVEILSEIYKIYMQYYQNCYFISFLKDKELQLKDVIGTNMCNISVLWDERTNMLKIFTVIDNLLKGASGQAVQNMNIAMGFEETEGLIF